MTPQRLAQYRRDFERCFGRIRDERMADVPILNNRIGIHLIGLRPWKDGAIGVLITPWFMNLLLLPPEPGDWDDLPELSEHEQAFPSGRYRFLLGREPGLGSYLMCSLFSPMFEFADDRAAVETAEAVIEGLFDGDNINLEDAEACDIEAIWRGEKLRPTALPEADTPADTEDTVSAGSERSEAPKDTAISNGETQLSRRQLLRGAFRQRGVS